MHSNNLLVIGASSELGIAYITKYKSQYTNIIAHFNSNSVNLDNIAKDEPNIIKTVSADLSLIEGVDKLITYINECNIFIDSILFLAAPKPRIVRFHKKNWADFENSINVQTRSAFIILQNLLPKMVSKKYGKVLFILSNYVDAIPPQGLADYIIGKYSFLGLMKCAAAEYSSENICINSVSPSMMETQFLSKIPQFVIEKYSDTHPKKRNITIHEVIPIIRHLISNENLLITGQNILVSGGG